jgi:hypothetical protein
MPNTDYMPHDDPQVWLSRPPEEVAARQEVDHVVLDRYWALQEIVLTTGIRVRHAENKERA